MNITCSLSQARKNIITYMLANLVPMLVGSPGTGKSAIIHSIAEEYNLKVIDLRLSQCDPTDLLGFPNMNGSKAVYVPMATFPIQGDELPIKLDSNGQALRDAEGKELRYSGWLLFLDEFSSASRAVQAASYKLTLDRMVGQYHLHDKVKVVCAGNMATDNAIVEEMSTALQSRLAHIQLSITTDDWLEYANKANYDFRIMAYLRNNPSKLYTFDPDHTDCTYACPRTWEFANRILKTGFDVNDANAIAVFAGVIGEGIAAEFVGYTRLANEIPSLKTILTAPDTVAVPQSPGIMFLVSSMLSQVADKDNISNIAKYVKRFLPEFQVVVLRNAVQRDLTLITAPELQSWLVKEGKAFF